MQVLKLVMGEDDKDCLLCKRPHASIQDAIPMGTPFPWKLCPTHFGLVYDDPAIRETCKMGESLP